MIVMRARMFLEEAALAVKTAAGMKIGEMERGKREARTTQQGTEEV